MRFAGLKFLFTIIVTLLLSTPWGWSRDYSILQLADETYFNREPVISETGLIAWYAMRFAGTGLSDEDDNGMAQADIWVYNSGQAVSLTLDGLPPSSADVLPSIYKNSVVWNTTFDDQKGDETWTLKQVPREGSKIDEIPAVYQAHTVDDGDAGNSGRQWFTGPPTNYVHTNIVSAVTNEANEVTYTTEVVTNLPPMHRHPAGNSEICMWKTDGEITRVTRDVRNDLAASLGDNIVAWQKAKGWPFGWEIMVWDYEKNVRMQLTTNFYYDIAPQCHKQQVTWYGWDGEDYEIYLYDYEKGTTTQITSNRFDDMSPKIWDGQIVWEGYPSMEGDIYLYKNGEIQKLSDNIEEDSSPSIWNGRVVWQGFDGDDFEIYYYDGNTTIKLTSNLYDDIQPVIRDNLIVWMGYFDNWDAEIFVREGDQEAQQLTDNDFDDRDPKTAAGRIVWQADHDGKSQIFLAEPANQ